MRLTLDRTLRDIVLAPYPSGPIVPLANSAFGEAFGKVSPDGRWLAYVSNEGGPFDVYVQSFPSPGHKTRVTTGGAEEAWWMPGGDELCYRTTDHTLVSVKLVRHGEDVEVGEPRLLFRYPTDVEAGSFAPDGQRLLVTISEDGGHNRRARLILDWTALIGR